MDFLNGHGHGIRPPAFAMAEQDFRPPARSVSRLGDQKRLLRLGLGRHQYGDDAPAGFRPRLEPANDDLLQARIEPVIKDGLIRLGITIAAPKVDTLGISSPR
jgi:hypothetical protein